MQATNINIEQFIEMLIEISEHGVEFIDMEIVKDPTNKKSNKLILYPVKEGSEPNKKVELDPNASKIILPNINTDNDDIYTALNDEV